MFANFVVIVILVLTHRPGREPKLRKNPLPAYIPTGGIFILAQGGSHILVEGGNFAWRTGSTRAGFSNTDELKYQKTGKTAPVLSRSEELLTVKLLYKLPDGNTSKKFELPLVDNHRNNVSSDFRFASAVAMFGQLLRNSDFKSDASYDKVINLARNALDNDKQGYRREFVRLVEAVKGIEK